MELLKDLLIPKCFNVWGYIVVLLYLVIGVTFTGITGHLKSSEKENFRCMFDQKIGVHQRFVEVECFSQYQQAFNSPFPLYGFVVLTFGAVTIVCVIYSFCLKSRVEEIENFFVSRDEFPLLEPCEGTTAPEKSLKYRQRRQVFWCYIIHLIIRFLLGFLFTVLQHKVFYTQGFQSDFLCRLNPNELKTISNGDRVERYNTTSTDCHNALAAEKAFWSTAVSIVNGLFASLALGEVVYLAFKFGRRNVGLAYGSDVEFCLTYLLGKRRCIVEMTSTPNDGLDIYRARVLGDTHLLQSCTGKRWLNLDEASGNIVILRNDSLKPLRDYKQSNDIPVQEPKELFLPNKDTIDSIPRTILVFGEKGSGKTALCAKIVREWAKKVDEFYADKIVVLIKFAWFTRGRREANLSLKELLHHGTQLDKGKFEQVFRKLSRSPAKAILIFDGLGDLANWNHDFEEETAKNDPNERMPVFCLFVKLICGKIFSQATILTTTDPDDGCFAYIRMKFDRFALINGMIKEKPTRGQ